MRDGSVEPTLEEAMTETDANVDLNWCNLNPRGFLAIRVLRAEVRRLRSQVNRTYRAALEQDRLRREIALKKETGCDPGDDITYECRGPYLEQ